MSNYNLAYSQQKTKIENSTILFQKENNYKIKCRVERTQKNHQPYAIQHSSQREQNFQYNIKNSIHPPKK